MKTIPTELTIDPEFAALIPPLEHEEREQLEKNILADGCRDPLTAWQGTLVDGHNRHDICTKRGIAFEVCEIEFADRDEAKVWMINNQLGRRNLPPYVRVDLAIARSGAIEAKAKANLERSGKEFGKGSQKSANPIEPIDTRAEIAAIAGVSHDTVAKVKKIKDKASPEVIAKLRANEISINQAHKEIVKEEKRQTKKQDMLAAVENLTKTPDFKAVCDIRECSMSELFAGLKTPDAVITDPPYPEEFLPLYEELARHCAKAGVKVVAAMAGQSYLPHIYAAMSKHLKYRWTLAYMTPGGQAVQQWQAKVNTFWKPVLLFGESEEWFGDVATSRPNDNDKRFHGWGQSESGMLDLVDRLTKPGQLVCDPFVGGGTTAVACLALGRSFIGCDIDGDHVANAEARALKIWEDLKCTQ
jgi:site-specific DNA-methyltransferase (adenine-specific)